MLEPSADEESGQFLSDHSRAQWLSSEVMLTRRVAGRHFLTGGFEYRESFRQDQWAEYADSAEVYLDLDRSSRVFAAYAQDEFTVSPRLTFSAGVRRDQDSNSIGATNLRFAAIVKPVANSSLKFLHGNAFRAPNPYERYYYANPLPLVPERITTSEVVWEQYIRRGTRLSASAFYYHARDLISQLSSEDSLDDFVTF